MNLCSECPFQCTYMCKNCHEYEDYIDDPEVNYEG